MCDRFYTTIINDVILHFGFFMNVFQVKNSLTKAIMTS